MKISYDPFRCSGCQACQMACLDQRDCRPGRGERFLCRIEPVETETCLSFRWVDCTHCGTCAAACPGGSLFRDAYGLIQASETRCTGCGKCIEVCPRQVITLDVETGRVKKCDLCLERVKAGLLPACVHTCPTGALKLEGAL